MCHFLSIFDSTVTSAETRSNGRFPPEDGLVSIAGGVIDLGISVDGETGGVGVGIEVWV